MNWNFLEFISVNLSKSLTRTRGIGAFRKYQKDLLIALVRRTGCGVKRGPLIPKLETKIIHFPN